LAVYGSQLAEDNRLDHEADGRYSETILENTHVLNHVATSTTRHCRFYIA